MDRAHGVGYRAQVELIRTQQGDYLAQIELIRAREEDYRAQIELIRTQQGDYRAPQVALSGGFKLFSGARGSVSGGR